IQLAPSPEYNMLGPAVACGIAGDSASTIVGGGLFTGPGGPVGGGGAYSLGRGGGGGGGGALFVRGGGGTHRGTRARSRGRGGGGDPGRWERGGGMGDGDPDGRAVRGPARRGTLADDGVPAAGHPGGWGRLERGDGSVGGRLGGRGDAVAGDGPGADVPVD